MAIETAKPLVFPVPFPDVPMWLFAFDLLPEAAAKKLGPPMLTDWIDGLGNADFWAFEFPCGLQVAFEFLHTATFGRVVADSPEIDHVLRHIPFSGGIKGDITLFRDHPPPFGGRHARKASGCHSHAAPSLSAVANVSRAGM
ncbi:hypothetical protein [Humisphaera borealis]|uniref:Uncharacterized protein n=1 Tax=Humisphaera borealis TaxID=2807512 RepID=A0A7M2WRZ3_9BACT|nr:hypothetical protein [Humisphaera borealis]QOV88044.1 hypothetical protein IPV69_17465 [Humisphaera borealis]